MTKKKFLLLLLCLLSISFFSTNSFAQRFADEGAAFWNGIGPGFSQSSIERIYPMIVDTTKFAYTQHEERKVNAIGLSYWFRAGVPDTGLFGEFGFSIFSNDRSKQTENEGGHFYLQNERGLEYTILFDYDHIGLSGHIGYFFSDLFLSGESPIGLYLVGGMKWTIPSGKGILYKSSESEFNLAVQETLRNALKIRNDVQFSAGAGIQFFLFDGFAVETRYSTAWGLADIIETQNNPYFWIEDSGNKTRLHHQFTLAFLLKYN